MKIKGMDFSFENKKWIIRLHIPNLQTFVGVGTTKEKAFQSLLKDIDIEIREFNKSMVGLEKLRVKSINLKTTLNVWKVKILEEN